MDILFALGIVVAVLGFTFGMKYLLDRYGIIYNPADIAYVQSIFGLSMEIIDELDLKEEPEIKKIANIVSKALNQVLMTQTYVDNGLLRINTLTLVDDICFDVGIIITPEREKIMQALVDIGLNNLGLNNVNQSQSCTCMKCGCTSDECNCSQNNCDCECNECEDNCK